MFGVGWGFWGGGGGGGWLGCVLGGGGGGGVLGGLGAELRNSSFLALVQEGHSHDFALSNDRNRASTFFFHIG